MGGPTTYSGAICIANKQNLLKKREGGRTSWTPPGSASAHALDMASMMIVFSVLEWVITWLSCDMVYGSI